MTVKEAITPRSVILLLMFLIGISCGFYTQITSSPIEDKQFTDAVEKESPIL